MIRNVEDPVFNDGNLSKRNRIRKGRVDIAFEYHDERDNVWAVYNSFDEQELYFFGVTENDGIVGGDDGTNFEAVPVDVFVSEPMPSETKDDPWKVMIYIYFKNTIDNFKRVVLPNDSTYNTGTLWSPSDLEGIVDVVITEGTGSATNSLKVAVAGKYDSRVVSTLVTADFIVTDAAGNTESVTASYDSTSGEYTLAGTLPADTYTVTLENQPDMTTKGFECQSGDSVDITVT